MSHKISALYVALKINNTTIYIKIYIVATTTLKCMKYHKQKLKIDKLRMNRTLLSRRMTNLTDLLYQENSYTHQCTAIAFYRKPVKRVIRSHHDNINTFKLSPCSI